MALKKMSLSEYINLGAEEREEYKTISPYVVEAKDVFGVIRNTKDLSLLAFFDIRDDILNEADESDIITTISDHYTINLKEVMQMSWISAIGCINKLYSIVNEVAAHENSIYMQVNKLSNQKDGNVDTSGLEKFNWYNLVNPLVPKMLLPAREIIKMPAVEVFNQFYYFSTVDSITNDYRERAMKEANSNRR